MRGAAIFYSTKLQAWRLGSLEEEQVLDHDLSSKETLGFIVGLVAVFRRCN